jgi:pyruvate,orthophosphate dikinase
LNEGLLTKEEAILKVEPKQLDYLLHILFDATGFKNAKKYSKRTSCFTRSCMW